MIQSNALRSTEGQQVGGLCTNAIGNAADLEEQVCATPLLPSDSSAEKAHEVGGKENQKNRCGNHDIQVESEGI